jgi:uncharacterized protein (UPF0262 family)
LTEIQRKLLGKWAIIGGHELHTIGSLTTDDFRGVALFVRYDMSWRAVAGWNEHKLVELTADLFDNGLIGALCNHKGVARAAPRVDILDVYGCTRAIKDYAMICVSCYATRPAGLLGGIR